MADDVIGPAFQSDAADPKSMLATFNAYDIVEVFNPLSKTFRGVVARSIPVNVGETARDREMRILYGTDLRNPDRNGRNMNHVQQPIEIEAGKSKKLPGDVAKVVATQLINEMMQREGNTNKLADMVQRRTYEERVVLNSVKTFDEATTLSVEDRLTKQIEDLNKPDKIVKEVKDEQPFPGQQDTETIRETIEVTKSVNTTGTRKVGRPAKGSQSSPATA